MKLFQLKDKKLIKSCLPILSRLYQDYKKTYIDIFFYEKDVEFNKFDLNPLLKAQILKPVGNKFRANVQVFPLTGKFICTDFNYSAHRKIGNTYTTQKDGVWGILPEETPLIAKKAAVQKDDLVLDLATGSGMIAIFCADRARKIIATDINPRCINFGKFNAILNNVENKIEFRTGDLFEPVEGIKFDLIIWNGPTVSVPETPDKYPVYSYGGLDGTAFTKRFIDQAFYYLKPRGRIQWYDCAAGTNKLPASMIYLKSKWKNKGIRVLFTSLTSHPLLAKKVFEIYAKYNFENPKFKTPLETSEVIISEEQAWHKWLIDKGYTHFYYALVEVKPSSKFELNINFPKKDIRTDRYLTRYWLWMSYLLILKKLGKCETY